MIFIDDDIIQRYSIIGGWAWWTGQYWSKDKEIYQKIIDGRK